MRSRRSLLILVALLHCIDTAAQTHIGISLNIGNRQRFDPGSKGFSKALAPSGSLFINQKKTLKNEWKVQYGATVGIVPYKLNVIGIDTITATDSGVYPFPDYSTLFISADLQPGRQISIGKNKNLLIALGGGLTYYVSFFPTTTYQIGVTDNNESFTVFKGQMDAPANTYSLFGKAAAYYQISNSFTVGAEYVHHMKSASEGTYTFYHTKTPQSGRIEVYQREFRFTLSHRLGNKKKKQTEKDAKDDKSHASSGHLNTYLGIEGAHTNDLFTVMDNGNSLRTVPLPNVLGGISIRREINTRLFLETGLLVKPYWQGFGFKNIAVYNTTLSFDAWLIPLRVGYKIKFVKGFFLVPTAGVTLGINPSVSLAGGYGHGTLRSGSTTIEYDYEDNEDVNRYFILAQPSISLEKEIFKTLLLCIYVNRGFGFNKVTQLDISYSVNNSAPISGRGQTNGDYWSYGLRLKYPISKIWMKK